MESANAISMHPLIRQNVLLPTYPAEELYAQVRRIVALRETGCCFLAPPGAGKTFAIEIACQLLKVERPELVTVVYDAQNQQFPSIRAFFKGFLETLGHTQLIGESYDLRSRVVHWFIDAGLSSGTNMVVLFIDEAQTLALKDFDFLKDVFNALGRSNVQLITILVGQDPDMKFVIDGIRSKQRLEIIGRFTMRLTRFRCFNSVRDIEYVLRGIDEAEYPIGLKKTWTQYFFPQAYDSGFRLQTEAHRFYDIVVDLSGSQKGRPVDIPARQTFLAIRTLISDNMRKDKPDFSLTLEDWEKAIVYSKIKEAIGIMRLHRSTVEI